LLSDRAAIRNRAGASCHWRAGDAQLVCGNHSPRRHGGTEQMNETIFEFAGTKRMTIPSTQHAVQLIGPGQLRLNPAKAVSEPRPHEMLIRIEACGLCFSDLKLLKQFHAHARKSPVIAGLAPDVLANIQSYA